MSENFGARLAQAVGREIRIRRTAIGLRQCDLASRIDRPGFERVHVSRLERGVHVASLPFLASVAKALGTDLVTMLGCIDGMVPHD